MFSFHNVKGIRTRMLDTGQGDPIILLHGWGTKIESLFPISSYLEKRMRVIAVDFPGFGQTDFPPRAWGVGDYTEWLILLIRKLNIETACFLGHSFGGRVCIKLASLYPQMVKKMILIDSAGVRQFEFNWRNQAISTVSMVIKPLINMLPKQLVNKIRWRFYSSIGSTDYLTAGRLKETYQKIINEDLEPVLSNIASPTLLIWGENDRDTPLADGMLMAQKIHRSKLITIKSAGHFPFIDDPAQVNKHIEDFLNNDGTLQ